MKQIQLRHESDKWVKRVADMVYKEFVAASGSGMPYEDVFSFFSNAHSETLPVTFIAIIDDECAGTVSAFEHDCKERPEYKPWLASLFVEPACRSLGIGQTLIEALLSRLYRSVFEDRACIGLLQKEGLDFRLSLWRMSIYLKIHACIKKDVN